jgi:hypothetical protein
MRSVYRPGVGLDCPFGAYLTERYLSDVAKTQLVLPMRPKHLQRYLDEFVFRFDRRWKEAELFPRILHCAIDTKPFPYHRLTAERSGQAEESLSPMP